MGPIQGNNPSFPLSVASGVKQRLNRKAWLLYRGAPAAQESHHPALPDSRAMPTAQGRRHRSFPVGIDLCLRLPSA